MFEPTDIVKKNSFLNGLIAPLILAGFVTALAYQLFFYFAPFLWSFNVTLPMKEYVPDARGALLGPRSGVQVYALYGLVHLIVGVTFVLYFFIGKIHSSSLRLSLLILFALPALLFFREVGFTAPMAEYSRFVLNDRPGILFILSMLGGTLFLSLFLNRPLGLTLILAILLFPVCMVASSAYSTIDYNFILFPALKILHGCPLNQTGFQYDHLLSLLAVVWMKLGFSFYTFSFVGQISVYAFFVGLYLFGCRFFKHKGYALYLVTSAVLVRMYGNIADIIQCFQVTPLRLDWWFVVLLTVFYKGESHWLVGMVLGFLWVFHHAFGVIYTLTYGVFVLSLFAVDVMSKKASLKQTLRNYGVLYAKNLLLLGLSVLLYRLFFAFGQHAASVYRQQGFNFIRILPQSFYWYVPVMLSLVFILNWRSRRFLSERSFRSAYFLIFLAIGNSLYFFGRSHENNIINISSILLFCLFLLFDLLQSEWERYSPSRFSKWILPALAVVFIAGISCVYSGRGSERIRRQADNLRNIFSYDYGKKTRFHHDVEIVKKLTRSSPNVTFVSVEDGYYYYEGGYAPQNTYSATDSRLFLLKDYRSFLEKPLQNGHYLVMPGIPTNNDDPFYINAPHFGAVLSTLHAKCIQVGPEMFVMSDNPIG